MIEMAVNNRPVRRWRCTAFGLPEYGEDEMAVRCPIIHLTFEELGAPLHEAGSE